MTLWPKRVIGKEHHEGGGWRMGNSNYRGQSAGTGYVFGASLAMILSWSLNQSILWTIFHGFFSWLYVIYFTITHR